MVKTFPYKGSKKKLIGSILDLIFEVEGKSLFDGFSGTGIVGASARQAGLVVYANDFKFDNAPTLGKKPNFVRLKQIAPVKVLILDSLYAPSAGKTPSESIAREMLRDVLLGTDSTGTAIPL